MSLMRLLTTGKTLVDLKNSTGRYRVPGKNLLPKFGSAKNPFATPPKPPPVPAAVEAAPKAEVQTVNAAAAPPLKETRGLPVPPAMMKETKRLPFVAPRSSAQQQNSEPAKWQTFFGAMMRWAKKLNPLAWRSSRKPAVKSAIPRFDKDGLQGELSLENIKVVRNDLSDADMEIVPARTLTGQTNFKPALQAAAKTELAVSQGSAA